MVTTKLNLSMTEPQVRQIYAKQGDTGRVLDITLDQTPEDGTLRILRPDGVEVTSEAVTGGEESGSTFESLTEADVTELTVGIEPVQDLNGYDKPWVGGAGKNLCPNVGWVQGQLGPNGTLRSQPFSISSDYIFLDVGTYVASRTYGNDSVGNLAYHSYNEEKVWKSDSGWKGNPFIIEVTEPIFIRFTTRKNTSDALSPTDVDGAFKIQLELGSTATAWQPYSNICPITGHDEVTVYFGAEQGTAEETYTTSLGQTVYGGTLDMVSGVLTVDKAYVEFDGDANENWSLGSYGGNGYYRAYIAVSGIDTSVEDANVADIVSNQFSAISYFAGGSATGISSRKNIAQINVFQSVITTLESWRQHLATNPLQVVYKLAEPVTYQLTPQQIKTLIGTNNVWASSGQIVNITFTYGGLLSELPSEATEIVGKCYCDVEQNGVSSMPFTLNVKKNERQ